MASQADQSQSQISIQSKTVKLLKEHCAQEIQLLFCFLFLKTSIALLEIKLPKLDVPNWFNQQNIVKIKYCITSLLVT